MADALPSPATPEGAAGLAAVRADPAGALVALDFDGTLAPIVARPDDARPAEGALAALAALSPLVGSVLVLTGRPVADVLRLGAVVGVPGLERLVVLGQYGVERWAAESGETVLPEPPPEVAVLRERLPALLAAAGAPEGTFVEDKRISLVVHLRRTADPAGALDRLDHPVRILADELGLHVSPGRHVLEIRPDGMDKGRALQAYAEERGARSVLFAGDDLGDLPAFAAVRAGRAAGRPGLTVCSKSAEVTALQEEADLVVDGPAGVVALLVGLAAELRARSR